MLFGEGVEYETNYLCEIVTKELLNCVKYNDTERVRYQTTYSKFKLKEFDITKCKQWSQLASEIKQVKQHTELTNYKYNSVVGITLHTNKHVEILYKI